MKLIIKCLLYFAVGVVFTCFFGIAVDSVVSNDTEYITEIDSEYSTVGSEEDEVTVESNSGDIVSEPTEEETEEPTEDFTEEDSEIVDTEIKEDVYYCEWGDYYLTRAEYELLLTTVFCESGGESSTEQHAVACAILNQINSGKFGSTVHKVIYKKNNFSVTKWPNVENRGWTDKVKDSLNLALVYNPYPRNMYYFRTKHFHTFKGAIDYKKIGEFYFSTSN